MPKPYNERTALERRGTYRLQQMLTTAMATPCECDGYHGYVCPIHKRIRMIEDVLEERKKRGPVMLGTA